MHPDHVINRASWDELAGIHGQDAYYDAAALVAGRSSLIEEEEAALEEAVGPSVAGLRILHLQCHLGFDAITFARRGATVTGLDFSPVALERARDLAARCGVELDWVHADATDLPVYLHGRFDLVWATIGVLCWIADLEAWMRSVAAALAARGKLVLLDGHPGHETSSVPWDGASPAGPLPGRRRIESGWDYATPVRTGPQVQYTHGLPAVWAAAVAEGIQVDRVVEHTDVSCDLCNHRLRRENDGRYRRRVGGQMSPVLFTLFGTKAEAFGEVLQAVEK